MASTGQLAPGVLPHQEILRLCGLQGNALPESQGVGPIQPCRRQNVRSASYDLRLGTTYHFTDQAPTRRGKLRKAEVTTLTAGADEQIVLGPNQVVVVSSREKICMPDDMIGHITLKQKVLLQGLIMASQSQIDAGYNGWIYPLLYNLTDGEVVLKLDESIVRLELVRLPARTTRPYDGDFEGIPLARSLERPVGSSLAAMRDDFERLRDRIRNLPWYGLAIGALAIVVSIVIALLTGFIGEVHDARRGVSSLEARLEGPVQLKRTVAHLESRVASLQCEIRDAEEEQSSGKC
jgi:deoxycytidine triphosphate deaminase